MDGTVLFSAFYDICLAKNVPDLLKSTYKTTILTL